MYVVFLTLWAIALSVGAVYWDNIVDLVVEINKERDANTTRS